MDHMIGSVGTYWFSKKAGQELSSVGGDINSFSNSVEGGAKWLVNKVKGKMQKPLPQLLKEYDMPIGLFPEDATNYEFNEETKKLTVFIPSACEVGYKDSSILRFFTKVTGNLEKGKLANVEGIKTKVLLIWFNISLAALPIRFRSPLRVQYKRVGLDHIRGTNACSALFPHPTTKVTGNLEKGKLAAVEGIKTKVVLIWVKVSCITSEESKVHFSVGMTSSK
ncbi:hypothetical protein Cni_G15603 [Canna indica]|uniref:Uncharacterized protein n=1 Tax=Canna indica TaxID=4628 RepID=A0AAQ3QDF9_9LILI|nr:hypothetical protein Cni_G15603 [Canna indica]